LTDVFTHEAVAFVERHRAEPFFLHLAYNAPHFRSSRATRIGRRSSSGRSDARQ